MPLDSDHGARAVARSAGHDHPAADEIDERKRAILESAMDCIITSDEHGRIADFNAAAERTFGYHRDEVIGRTVSETVVPPRLRDAHDRGMARFLKTGDGAFLGRRVELPALRADGSEIPVELTITSARLSSGQRFITAYLRDITERRQNEAVQDGQRQALEMIARGEPLEGVLEMLVRALEGMSSKGSYGSVLLLDGVHLRHGAAPSLPDEYNQAIDGVEIGPDVGACGAAAYHGEVVVCADVATHPNWARFRDIALSAGLGAAWSTPIFSAAGKVLGTFAMYRDRPSEPTEQELWFLWQMNRVAALAIERRRADEALLASEGRFRAAFDQVAVGMVEADADGRLLRVNDEYCRITGYRREELLGRTVWEFTHPDDLPENRRRYDATVAARQPSHTVEKRYIRKDGTLIWVRVTANLMHAERDGGHYLLGVVEDIDERRRAEQRLRDSEEFRRRIIAASQDCIKVLDLEGRLLSMNEGGQCMLEIDDVAPLLNQPWQSFWQGEDRGAASAAVAAAAAGGRGRFRGYFPLVRSGTPKWWDVVVTPMLGNDGRPAQLLAVSRDVTEQVSRERSRQFLLDLSEATQPLTDPDDIMRTTAQMLGEHLGANRCAYAEVEEDEDHFTVVGDYTRDTFSIVGRHAMSAFGERALRRMRRGRTYVIDDIEAQAGGMDLAAYHQAGIQAVICVPLHKGGRLVAGMAVQQSTPRQWSPAEIELVRLVTGRCWEAIERARTSRSLREEQAKLALTVQMARLGHWRLDLQSEELTCSPTCKANFGRGPDDEFTYADLRVAIHPRDRERVGAAVQRAIRGGAPYAAEYRAIWPDRGIHWVYAQAEVVYDPDGTPLALNGTTLDITERKRAEALLDWQRRAFEQIARGEDLPRVLETLAHAIEEQTDEDFAASIMLLDDAGDRLHHGASPSLPEAFRQAVDGSPADPGASPCAAAIARGEPVLVPDFTREARWPAFRGLFRKPGLVACWTTPIFSTDGRALGTFGVHYREPWRPGLQHEALVATLVHVAAIAIERKRLEHQLRHSAFHDALTGQPNRALFMDRLGHVIARTERHGEGFALLMLDIDNFKLINDSFGHPAGDRLLIEFAQSVRRYLRPQDTLARLGGDEFCILVEEIESREDVLQVARRIQRRLGEQSTFVQGQEIRTSVSIGIAFERSGHRKPETALQDADIALYEAKRRGKNGYVIFDQGLRQGARAPLRLERALQRAITAGEISVEYQPIVDLATGRPIGCEALARWRHPQLGPVEPAQFIPLAEETGVIRPLGRFILETACREFAQWRHVGELPGDFYVAVNLSAHQFGQDDLVEQVIATLNRFGLEGRNLRLEVTESSIIANGERAARVIGELQDHGIRVCMDDFGVGYSSLSYLQRFPVSVLKLDRSFVSGLTEQPNTQAIVKTVLNLARNLGLEAVAEGAECNEQRDALRALGFTHAQGFLFHHPMSNEAMAGLVTRH